MKSFSNPQCGSKSFSKGKSQSPVNPCKPGMGDGVWRKPGELLDGCGLDAVQRNQSCDFAGNSVTYSYDLACSDIHKNPKERQVRQETKSKKSRNYLRDLDLPYFMRNILTGGAEGGIRLLDPDSEPRIAFQRSAT